MRRVLFFGVALVMCVLGGVGAASALTGGGDAQRPAGGDDAQRPAAAPRALEFGSARGTATIGASIRPNAGPPWAVLSYETESGKKCATTGQLVNGRVGRVDAFDKRFRPDDLGEVPCADLGSLPAGYGVRASVTGSSEVEGGDVTLVWGMAEPGVREVTVTRSGDGSQRRLSPSKDGLFLTAYAGHPLPDTVTVEAVSADGTRDVYEFPPVKLPSPEELRRDAAEHEAGH
jgi:hypothetical protein